jgi:predicted MFS family arabinose efflux permease
MTLSVAQHTNRTHSGLTGRDFVLLLLATTGMFANYAPLLSVVPLWSVVGGSAPGGAGAATGATMGTTVAVQLFMPRLLRRFGLRQLLAVGSVLLGLPTFGYLLSSTVDWVLTVSAVRGIGFGMITVAGSALAAELVPAEQRGRAVGWYGVAVGLPQVVFLPLAVWYAQHFGFAAIFVATGAISVLATPLIAAMSGQRVEDKTSTPDTSRVIGLVGRMSRPWLVFITVACALGGITTFVPLAEADRSVAPAALLTLYGTAIVGRWATGATSDRTGAGRFLIPGVAACVLGMAGFALAAVALPAAATICLIAAALYGLGFGALQNDTLVMMFRHAGPGGSGLASTAWNTAFDAGTGIGAVIIGLGTQALDIPGSFAATTIVVALILPVAWWEKRREIG